MKKTSFFRNICIGLVDGLTIPFALAAGLSGILTNSTTVIIACLVVAIAGAMTMTISGYVEGRKFRTGENHVLSALIIGAGYFSGGVITTIPYFIEVSPMSALRYSGMIAMAGLLIAGYWESKLNGSKGWTNAVRVCLTAAVAATAAFLLSKLFR